LVGGPERVQKFFGQDAQLKQLWIRKTIPKIKRTVKKYKAVLYFEDEASVSLAPMIGKTWSVKGKKAFVDVSGKRGSISAMSAISTTGQLLFSLYDKRITSNEVVEFLTHMLQHHPRRHIVVIMDQAPPHTSAKVRCFIEQQRRLHVFYLPPYSPELNPDEKVWNYLKHEALKNHQAKNKCELKRLTRKKLKQMSRNASLLRALFFRSCVAEFMN
jgi:transposase